MRLRLNRLLHRLYQRTWAVWVWNLTGAAGVTWKHTHLIGCLILIIRHNLRVSLPQGTPAYLRPKNFCAWCGTLEAHGGVSPLRVEKYPSDLFQNPFQKTRVASIRLLQSNCGIDIKQGGDLQVAYMDSYDSCGLKELLGFKTAGNTPTWDSRRFTTNKKWIWKSDEIWKTMKAEWKLGSSC